MAKTTTRINATARNLYLDIALTAGFLLTLKPFLTGIALHEWLGLAVGGGLIVHALLHRKWIAAITCRLGRKMPWRTRACYLLDALLLLAFGLLIVTGVLISQAVMPAIGILIMPSLLLAQAHNIAAWVALGALAHKLGLHTEWIVNAVRCHILKRQAVRTGRPGRCPEGASTVKAALYSRRQFLSACGLGIGSALALTLWRKWDTALPPSEGATAMAASTVPTPTDTASVAAVQPTALAPAPAATESAPVMPGDAAEPENPAPSRRGRGRGREDAAIEATDLEETDAPDAALELPQTATPTAVGEVTATPAPAATATPAVTIEPLATATPAAVLTTARCPYGLVNDPYPGKCRRYVDSNGNGYCDLSESA